MDDAVRRAALRATAKVALGLTMWGCVGQVTVDNDASTPATSNDPPPNPSSPDDPVLTPPGLPTFGEETSLACEAPPPGQEVSIDAAQLTCCADLVTPLIPDNSSAEAWTEAKGNADVQACCNVIVANTDAAWNNGDGTLAQELGATTWSCCDALGYPAGPTCTPWGPPPPPAFDAELARAWLEVA